MKNRILLILFIQALVCNSIFGQTKLQKTDSNWELIVNDKPFEVKGATFGYVDDIENYDIYFKDLKSLGVNTIRLWATDKQTIKLLDAAHKYDIKVMVGIWMRHGRPGMEDDDSFNYLEDNKGKEDMYTNAIKVVETFKNHPAVLVWGIGNEVYLNTATDEEKKAYSLLLEKICSKIKAIDQNHLITSVEAWTFGLDWWEKYVPSIDIYGLNSYGPGAGILSSELTKRNIDKPYIITEFGVTGEWDIKAEVNGIKQEPSDAAKYSALTDGYDQWIKPKANCLGVYMFHYSDGKDFISPWLFTHHNGKYRPQYWGIRKAYTGENPVNYWPEIKSFSLNKSNSESNAWMPVTLEVSDKENETLNVSFYYNQRTGSRKRRDQILPLQHRGDLASGFEILLPKVDGATKIYTNVTDQYGNTGIESTGIIIKDDEAKTKKYLVPKVELPFYVYKDGEDSPFAPSAYMGNYKDMTVDLNNTEDVFEGKAALKISYDAYDWFGLGLVDPANDWGEILGGYDLQGAETFSFWAKASTDNVVATIGFGLIGKDKPYPDTAKESKEIKLKTKWKKYTFKLKNIDLSCIRSGLVIFSSGRGLEQDIYIDNVVFE
ncbi:MAG: hypothetical protein ED556_10710 [Winogradskyella sp.]|uniref:glycoside hydrolase family 2 TIM barrel-domain containing protein n=1 Tax=Winogradskyella sp. TaxID=1883156 RepID=UPI000F3CE080|nr:glycoside hydrolase family 2 TIM barrel-domain containing protein [Winogradskyella sp.]RNC85032.1 MAG: hypothetical protein ED556_10710 [Winogradskyella sp.]